MNENQLKTKIFILKTIDRILLTILLVMVGYTVFFVEQKEMMIMACLGCLFVVTFAGRFIKNTTSILSVQLEMTQREKKSEEQRTLMATRHTTRR